MGNPKNSNITPDVSVNSATRYRATDRTAPHFYIDARLVVIGGKTFVGMVIETKQSGVAPGAVPGKDFLAAMIAHFGLGNLDGILGDWSTGIALDSNIDDFNDAVSVYGDTPTGRTTAALDGTWTGGQAKVYGFTVADVYFRDPLSKPYLEVKVTFTRP